MTAGVDRLPEEILKSGIRVANASGLHGAAMGEVVLELMLMFVKDAPACMRMKQGREWRRYRPGILQGQTVEILYENLRRYLAGDPFLHEVNREKGIDSGR